MNRFVLALAIISTCAACKSKSSSEAPAGGGSGSIFVAEKEVELSEVRFLIHPYNGEPGAQWGLEAKLAGGGKCEPANMRPYFSAAGRLAAAPSSPADLMGMKLAFDSSDDEEGTTVCAPSADARMLTLGGGPSFTIAAVEGDIATIQFSGTLNPFGPNGPVPEGVSVRGEIRATVEIAR